jgi:hypothetical protein
MERCSVARVNSLQARGIDFTFEQIVRGSATMTRGRSETTSSTYTSHAVSIPGSLLTSHVHGWVQFPPGDLGLLGIGGDQPPATGSRSFRWMATQVRRSAST